MLALQPKHPPSRCAQKRFFLISLFLRYTIHIIFYKIMRMECFRRFPTRRRSFFLLYARRDFDVGDGYSSRTPNTIKYIIYIYHTSIWYRVCRRVCENRGRRITDRRLREKSEVRTRTAMTGNDTPRIFFLPHFLLPSFRLVFSQIRLIKFSTHFHIYCNHITKHFNYYT